VRFTLAELEEAIPKILRSGEVNKPIESYPILHHALIELRDCVKKAKHPRYLQLIEIILKHPDCDPDVFDKHQKSALMYAAEEGNAGLASLLLSYKANPDLKSGLGGWRALEYGVLRNPVAKTTRILAGCTRITKNMSDHFKEMLRDAIEEKEVEQINALLDLNLVHYQQKFERHFTAPNNVPSGFWIHTVGDIGEESRVLKRRDYYHSEQLAMQRHGRDYERDQNYTRYTSATFVQRGAPIALFGLNEPGVMIRSSPYPIHYWYDGHTEELTRDMNFSSDRPADNGQPTGQYWELTATQVQALMQEKFQLKIDKCKRHAQKNPEDYDRHGVLLDESLCDLYFRWNEGLLRYKRSDVFGIHVNPDSKKCCEEALKLREEIGHYVPLYHYDACSGTVQPIRSRDLLQRWELESTVASRGSVEPLVLSGGHRLTTTHRRGEEASSRQKAFPGMQ
jgi:hypothetical protein